MRRADRLFQLVQLIRGRRLSTAAWLAQRLEVSERTVYRDVADLQHQGVPIRGEAGVGYCLEKGFDLPPLMFTTHEAQALVASVRMASAWMDTDLAQHAQEALGKVLAALPASYRTQAEQLAVYAPPVAPSSDLQHLGALRQAVALRQTLQLHYQDAHNRLSQRTIRPLGCFYWGQVWTLGAWCEDKHAFRSFRIDRIQQLQVLHEASPYPHQDGQTVADYVRANAPTGTWQRLQ
ncbi:YafY family transcriptional regulator [Curvibacter sp. CHRR-16]|uniref:helix-turn-helix transcriptional regulator n=1 Tax=Curvibacter sp. CHRR-16 TaxID=2835872 RepID=UPI001BD91453|nr:YafY family protein [Curvibacter sp. CHRR-16]MBT0569337.1 YafY family transcriptional regulator [Curvibacter sp. CHRR-16]